VGREGEEVGKEQSLFFFFFSYKRLPNGKKPPTKYGRRLPGVHALP
jgi:hypothetical protein